MTAATSDATPARRPLPAALAIFAMLSAAACAPVPATPPLAAGPAPATAQPTAEPEPAERHAALTPGTPANPDDPTRLKGLISAELAGLLGAPTNRRRDAPAEIWQYFGPGCIVDVFLYDEGQLQRVEFVQLRSPNPAQAAPSSCFAAMVERHGEHAS